MKIHNVKQDSVKRHIVPLQNTSVEIVPGRLESVQSIEVLKKRMLWNNDKKTFQSIPYPVHEQIEHYQTSEGFTDKKDVSKANLVWGSNKMHIPIPTFMDRTRSTSSRHSSSSSCSARSSGSSTSTGTTVFSTWACSSFSKAQWSFSEGKTSSDYAP